jgi:hypothetical protein
MIYFIINYNKNMHNLSFYSYFEFPQLHFMHLHKNISLKNKETNSGKIVVLQA